ILNDFQLEANASLVNVLKRKKNLFIKNELESDNTPESKEALLTLEKKFTTVCVPVIIKKKLLGIINLGEKLTNEIYTNEDLNLLSTLANQLSVALENAISYDELSKTYKELHDTQAQLVHSAKLASIGEMAAGVAHEVNNPISFIDKRLEGMRFILEDLEVNRISTSEACAELGAMIKKADESVVRIKNIVHSLLNFSRKGDNNRGIVNISDDTLNNTLVILENRLRHDQISLEKIYGKVDNFQGDLQQLNQVFLNLLSNAIDSIDEARIRGKSQAGHIQLITKQGEGHAVISIKDDGIGIPREIQDKIFDPFFTTKEVGKGTGLGLYISYRIVQDHRGSIEVKSEEGEGAEFIIKLLIEN
ncbi:MAG: ATP-binding protein, partial [bacterium]